MQCRRIYRHQFSRSDFCVCVIFSTVWYELQVGDWPITNQPVEAKIWLVGSNEGIKKVLADANLGKEVTVRLLHRWDTNTAAAAPVGTKTREGLNLILIWSAGRELRWY